MTDTVLGGTDLVAFAFLMTDRTMNLLIGALRDNSNPPWGWYWTDGFTNASNLNCTPLPSPAFHCIAPNCGLLYGNGAA